MLLSVSAIDMRRMVRISDGADRVERLCEAAADSLFHVQPLVINAMGSLMEKGYAV